MESHLVELDILKLETWNFIELNKIVYYYGKSHLRPTLNFSKMAFVPIICPVIIMNYFM